MLCSLVSKKDAESSAESRDFKVNETQRFLHRLIARQIIHLLLHAAMDVMRVGVMGGQ